MAQTTHQSAKVTYQFGDKNNLIVNYVFTFNPHIERLKNLISKKYKIKKEEIINLNFSVN